MRHDNCFVLMHLDSRYRRRASMAVSLHERTCHGSLMKLFFRALCVLFCVSLAGPLAAQQLRRVPPGDDPARAPGGGPAVPGTFLIGVGDVLTITFWRDEKLSREVLVRPDGRISLPLLNDIQAAGYT